MSGQLDLGEVALSDGFEQPVVADVGLLRLLGAAGSHAGPDRARADLLTPITVRRVLQKRHIILDESRSVNRSHCETSTCISHDSR